MFLRMYHTKNRIVELSDYNYNLYKLDFSIVVDGKEYNHIRVISYDDMYYEKVILVNEDYSLTNISFRSEGCGFKYLDLEMKLEEFD